VSVCAITCRREALPDPARFSYFSGFSTNSVGRASLIGLKLAPRRPAYERRMHRAVGNERGAGVLCAGDRRLVRQSPCGYPRDADRRFRHITSLAMPRTDDGSPGGLGRALSALLVPFSRQADAQLDCRGS
jgi:hypothetical protein